MTVHRLSNNDQCAVCGGWRIGWTGYVFFDDGATHTGIPFCKTHADQLQQFSNPAFESDVALSLFKKLHPRKYRRDVEGKQIIFLKREVRK